MNEVRVILVDDEDDFREPVSRFLSKAGMVVKGVESVEALFALYPSFQAQVIVLDINLPGRSGLEVVGQLRRETSAGLVMLTARGGQDDRIQGLSLGADSYFAKPVDLRELQAVISNLADRVHADTPDVWRFDRSGWVLHSPAGERIDLTKDEYRLLIALTKSQGEVVERDDLLRFLGKTPRPVDDRRVDVLISRLRAKFQDRRASLPVRSVRGIGYIFSKPIFLEGEETVSLLTE